MFPRVRKPELKALIPALEYFISWQVPAVKDAYARAKVLVKFGPRSAKYRAGAQFVGAMRHLKDLQVSDLALENKNLLWYQGPIPGFYALTEASTFFNCLATTMALSLESVSFNLRQATAIVFAVPQTPATGIINGQQESAFASASVNAGPIDGLLTQSQSSMKLKRFHSTFTFPPALPSAWVTIASIWDTPEPRTPSKKEILSIPRGFSPALIPGHLPGSKLSCPSYRSYAFSPLTATWECRTHPAKELFPVARDLLPGSEPLGPIERTDRSNTKLLRVTRQWGKFYPGVIGKPSPALLSAIKITRPQNLN